VIALELGEGARWVEDRLVVVDILHGDLYELVGDDLRRLLHVELPLGAVAPVHGGTTWIAAVGDGVALLDGSGALDWLDRPESRHGGRTRMNDGVCDPAGRFWAGSMAYDGSSPLGSLYRVDGDGCVHQVLDDIVIANGPAFSADGTTMYLADSGRRTVTRYRIADDGTPCDPVLLLRADGDAGPDGMTVDSSGALWVAMWGGAEVRRLSRDGGLLGRVPLAARQPTSIALRAGNAFVTTAYLGLDQPGEHDGRLLRLDLSAFSPAVAALPTCSFGDGDRSTIER
jgi:sugar lactone lactonase YvrE